MDQDKANTLKISVGQYVNLNVFLITKQYIHQHPVHFKMGQDLKKKTKKTKNNIQRLE